MKNDDLQFSVTSKDGKEVLCTVLSIIPKGDGDGYVVFVDDNISKEETPYLQYGLLEHDSSGKLILKRGVSDEELAYIKEHTTNDLLEIARRVVQRHFEKKENKE